MDFSKIKEKIEKLLKNEDKKKTRDVLITFVILGVVLILAANFIFSGGKAESKVPDKNDTYVEASKISTSDEKDELQKKLESILSKISGAGNVNVMITYTTSKETIPAYDTKNNSSDIQEKDNTGGTRNTKTNDSQSQMVFEESSGGTKKPVVLKELSPEIKGVLIVADGASDAVIRESLVRAAQVVLDIPVHKIEIASSKK